MGANKYSASGKTDYETPQALFDEWNKIFGFNLDACATIENRKKSMFISPERDAFLVDWNFPRLSVCNGRVVSGRVWCNPPYGKNIKLWIARAIQQVNEGSAEFVVMLLPANTDTRWFHNLCKKHGKIKFLPGRITFVGENGGNKNGSMLVLFGKDPTDAGIDFGKTPGVKPATPNWEWDMEAKHNA